MTKRILTNSSGSCYDRCPREYFFRYEVGRCRRHVNVPLRDGTAWHGLLKDFWLSRPIDVRQLDGLDPFSRGKLRAMFLGYCVAMKNLASGVEVRGVEVPFRVPLVNPETGKPSTYWDQAGVLDGIVSSGGRTYVMEHKSTSEKLDLTGPYFVALRLDSQISTYLGATKQEAEGVWYDVARKPQLDPLMATPEEKRKFVKKTGELYAKQRDKDETPEEYFQRCLLDISKNPGEYFCSLIVVRLESEVIESAKNTWHRAAQIRLSIGSGVFPQRTGSCRRRYGMCEFFPACSGTARIDDDNDYQDNVPHSEIPEEYR